MFYGIFEFGIGFGRCLFDELEGLTLCGCNGVRISMLGTMRDNLFTETVGEIETMAIRWEFTRIGFELFV